MADDKLKPSIPAWQQAAQQQPSRKTTDDGVKIECTATPPTTDGPEAIKSGLPTLTEPVTTLAAEEAISNEGTAASQLENMKTFLEDPAVKSASPEKKRAFFESKGIAADLIHQALKSEGAAFNANDFESFKQTQAQAVQPTSPPQPPTQQMQSAPPIITYPEFLVEAHKPAPLLTPSRIVATAYITSILYALLYGASQFLVTPMSSSLSAARHDFALHNQAKLDELNARLTNLVTKIPSPKKEKPPTLDSDLDTDVSSETSDPTELYHRDMGTQTSPLPSRRPSSSFSSLPGLETDKKKDPLSHQTHTLQILQSHLTDLLAAAESLEQPNKDRQESLNRLRGYVEGLMYASPSSYGMWNAEDGEAEKKKEGEDVIEEVKREIRGVKGVLLSAKRFPGVGGRGGG